MSNTRKARPKPPDTPPPRRSYSSAATDDDAATTEGIDFWLDGVQFICHGRISAFDLAEMAGRAEDAGPEITDPGVIRILSDFTKSILGEQTYYELTKHRRKHRTPDAVIQQIIFDMIEDTIHRPIRKPSPSPAGPETVTSQPDVSPSPVSEPAAPADGARRERALAMLAAQGDIRLAAAGPPTPAGPRPPTIRTVSFEHPEKGVKVEAAG
jgi:hypothetical protein